MNSLRRIPSLRLLLWPPPPFGWALWLGWLSLACVVSIVVFAGFLATVVAAGVTRLRDHDPTDPGVLELYRERKPAWVTF